MITLRRATERHYRERRKQEVWLTFYPRDRADPRADRFGLLESFSERRLPPGGLASRHPYHDAEIVTYVRRGAMAYEDAEGCSGVIQAGEFQRTSAGRGIRRREANASRTAAAHVFQVLLRSSEAGREPDHELRRFSVAERRGGLCVVASLDARRGSLRIGQDALIYSAVLDRGQHVVHELSRGRSVWLHLVAGQATLGNVVLGPGDGVGLRDERAVSLTAREATEILLVDLSETAPGWRDNGDGAYRSHSRQRDLAASASSSCRTGRSAQIDALTTSFRSSTSFGEAPRVAQLLEMPGRSVCGRELASLCDCSQPSSMIELRFREAVRLS